MCSSQRTRCPWRRVARGSARGSQLFLRKPRSEVLEKFRYAHTLLTPGNTKSYSLQRDNFFTITAEGAIARACPRVHFRLLAG
jgi:hypothetical protein